MISLQDVYAARDRIRPFIYRTPLAQSEEINAALGASAYLKLENLQVTNAFKIRGSSNRILQLTDEEKARGVITASSGNHAQGFSCAARNAGIDAVVVMPVAAPKNKIERCRNYGARVILHGECYDDCVRHAKGLCEKEKRVYIPSFDDEQVIAGNGTVALEIFDDLADCDVIFAPIGGGGLTSGVGFVTKTLHPHVQVIGVEAAGAPKMSTSLRLGKVNELETISTVADGIAVKAPGRLNFEYVRQFIDKIVLVTDEEMISALNEIWAKFKVVVEVAGAASLAAAIKCAGEIAGKKAVCIVSGGNVDKDDYVKYLKAR